MSELKVGDFVEVLRYKKEGLMFKEHWVAAVITRITAHDIEVKALREAFDSQGHEYLMVSPRERGRMWK